MASLTIRFIVLLQKVGPNHKVIMKSRTKGYTTRRQWKSERREHRLISFAHIQFKTKSEQLHLVFCGRSSLRDLMLLTQLSRPGPASQNYFNTSLTFSPVMMIRNMRHDIEEYHCTYAAASGTHGFSRNHLDA